MRSLQKMQTLRFCFFCQPLSSFSRFGRLLALAGIQRCLLSSSDGRTNALRAPVGAGAAGTALLLHLRGGPPQRRADLVGPDLYDGPLVALLRLPRALLEAADHDHVG